MQLACPNDLISATAGSGWPYIHMHAWMEISISLVWRYIVSWMEKKVKIFFFFFWNFLFLFLRRRIIRRFTWIGFGGLVFAPWGGLGESRYHWA
ncbi:hypothetical protein DFH27DRAFT_314386 [Peziza echinospora]|nr:hypothetical protein DFH27DRAFT_314386 [Peziza echinospora]